MKVSLNSITFFLALNYSLLNAIKCEEYFSSLVHLEKLAKQEGQLIKSLQAIANELNTDEYVQKKFRYFLYEHDFMQQDVAKYIENPLNSFSMIKRATVDLSLLIKHLPQHHAEILKIYRLDDSSLVHATQSLLLLQRLYKLQTRDIARGVIHSRRVGDKMSPHDLYVIGSIAANNITSYDEGFLAKEYLELAIEENIEKKSIEINETKLLMNIAQLCERYGDYRCAALHLKQLMLSEPNNVEVAEYALEIVKMFQEQKDSKHLFDDPFNDIAHLPRNGQYSKRKEFELISNVCRGKFKGNQLYCKFVAPTIFSKIAPFKLEVVNEKPHIFLYHGILSDSEIELLKKLSTKQQKSSGKSIHVTEYFDDDEVIISQISQRINDMTGLSMSVEEPLNLQHYGTCGPFWDQKIRRHKKIAMILFHMNDDHMDGATAFPYLSLQIFPPKGSAMLWFTLKVSSGQQEYGTRFTQCPVTYKSKWIASRDILIQNLPMWLDFIKNEDNLTLHDYDKKFF